MTAATEAVQIATFRVRATSVDPLVEALTATGAKLARKVPGLAVHVTTGATFDSRWCAAHRSWASHEQRDICDLLIGIDTDGPARCWITPAQGVEVDITATGIPTWGDWEVYAVLTTLAERFQQSYGAVLAKEPAEAPTVDVVALAQRYIAADGKFISPNTCDWRTQIPTAYRVREALTWDGNGTRPLVLPCDLTDADRAAARDAIAAVLADTSDNPYAVNLRRAAEQALTQVTGKGNTVGLLASLPGSADRAREWAAARAAREAERAALLASKTNAWVGVEGERRTFTGTIRSAATHRGDYGYYQVVVIDTAEGAVKILGRVSWPTEMPDAELAGRTVALTGTVARHEEFRGEKTTRINRVKVTELA